MAPPRDTSILEKAYNDIVRINNKTEAGFNGVLNGNVNERAVDIYIANLTRELIEQGKFNDPDVQAQLNVLYVASELYEDKWQRGTGQLGDIDMSLEAIRAGIVLLDDTKRAEWVEHVRKHDGGFMTKGTAEAILTRNMNELQNDLGNIDQYKANFVADLQGISEMSTKAEAKHNRKANKKGLSSVPSDEDLKEVGDAITRTLNQEGTIMAEPKTFKAGAEKSDAAKAVNAKIAELTTDGDLSATDKAAIEREVREQGLAGRNDELKVKTKKTKTLVIEGYENVDFDNLPTKEEIGALREYFAFANPKVEGSTSKSSTPTDFAIELYDQKLDANGDPIPFTDAQILKDQSGQPILDNGKVQYGQLRPIAFDHQQKVTAEVAPDAGKITYSQNEELRNRMQLDMGITEVKPGQEKSRGDFTDHYGQWTRTTDLFKTGTNYEGMEAKRDALIANYTAGGTTFADLKTSAAAIGNSGDVSKVVDETTALFDKIENKTAVEADIKRFTELTGITDTESLSGGTDKTLAIAGAVNIHVTNSINTLRDSHQAHINSRLHEITGIDFEAVGTKETDRLRALKADPKKADEIVTIRDKSGATVSIPAKDLTDDAIAIASSQAQYAAFSEWEVSQAKLEQVKVLQDRIDRNTFDDGKLKSNEIADITAQATQMGLKVHEGEKVRSVTVLKNGIPIEGVGETYGKPAPVAAPEPAPKEQAAPAEAKGSTGAVGDGKGEAGKDGGINLGDAADKMKQAGDLSRDINGAIKDPLGTLMNRGGKYLKQKAAAEEKYGNLDVVLKKAIEEGFDSLSKDEQRLLNTAAREVTNNKSKGQFDATIKDEILEAAKGLGGATVKQVEEAMGISGMSNYKGYENIAEKLEKQKEQEGGKQ